MIREQPWHHRHASTEHYRWFRNLQDLHSLTLSWTKNNDTPLLPHVNITLDSLLDDTHPHELLLRLEKEVWSTQAQVLLNSPKPLPIELTQAAQKSGNDCAASRWPHLASSSKEDLRPLLLCLRDSPFSGYPHLDGFLIRRAVTTEIYFELRACPHQSLYEEVRKAAQELCYLHSEWIRGFLYYFNPSIRMEYQAQPDRCTQRWS